MIDIFFNTAYILCKKKTNRVLLCTILLSPWQSLRALELPSYNESGGYSLYDGLAFLEVTENNLDKLENHVVIKHLNANIRRCLQHVEDNGQPSTDARLFQNSLRTFIEYNLFVLYELYYRMVDDGSSFSINLEKNPIENLNDLSSKLHCLNNILWSSVRTQSLYKEIKQKISTMQKHIASLFDQDYAFQSKPKLGELSHPLWSKLNELSVNRVVNETMDENCSVCHERLSDADVAILDGCCHYFCSTCAHKLFNNHRSQPR